MKKYLLGLFAVVLAVGFSAFTKVETAKNTTDYFYFSVNSGKGNLSTFINADLVWYEKDIAIDEEVCEDVEDYKCLIGFTQDQVTETSPGSGVYILNDNFGLNRQTPDASAGMRLRDVQ